MSKIVKYNYNSNINTLSLRENLIICHNSLVFQSWKTNKKNNHLVYFLLSIFLHLLETQNFLLNLKILENNIHEEFVSKYQKCD